MQSTFIWIVIFAGAAIALLGVFLVASERELKKKRQEVEELAAKLGEQPAEVAAPTMAMAMSAVDSEKVDALQAKNQQLENELATAMSKLDLSRKTIDELQDDQRRAEATQSNAQWLQTSNDQLKAEIDALKQRALTSEARVNESAPQSQEVGESQRQLEAQVASLQQQLTANQSKLREFDAIEQKLANAESIEASHRDGRRALETRIADLEQELSSRADKLRELDALRQRLAEAENSQHTLLDENRRYSDEIARWQQQSNEAEESRRWLAELREPFDTLLAKQAALEERQREFKGELLAFAQVLSNPAENSRSANVDQPRSASPAVEVVIDPPPAAVLEETTVAVAPTQLVAAQTMDKPKRRFGIFPVVIIVAAGAALMANLWSLQTVETSTPSLTARLTPATSLKKDAAPKVAIGESEPDTTSISASIVAKEPTKAPVKETNEKAKPVQTASNQTRLAGTYEITQLSRVYAAPSEQSQLVGDIEPGVKVNVVNGKDGWLEIHSKYGRPPGFIRRESARVAPQN
jgi:hypothetical protein